MLSEGGSVLLRFRIENFRSIRDSQELSLMAGTLSDSVGSVRRFPGIETAVLPVAAIYGANASGKTNVFRAVAYMDGAVEHSQRTWRPDGRIPFEPFRLSPDTASAPSTFEVDLLLEGTRYRYGFTLDSKAILREWLFAYPSGRRQTWFLRDTASKPSFTFGKQLLGENRTIENLTRANSLFLSAAAQNNHEQLLPIYRWFARHLQFVRQERSALALHTTEMCKDEDFKRSVLQLLTSADLGIVDLDIAEEPFDPEFLEALNNVLALFNKTTGADPTEKPKMPPTQVRAQLRHRMGTAAEGIAFATEDESAGTVAWLGLLGPALKTLQHGGTLFVDELDASLHPLLALELVKLFSRSETNPRGAQLIFNTHDTNLLDRTLLRRDQIWFVEKDETGASHLYPLTDFKPRKDENLERGYLQGRYGAIPYIRSAELGSSRT